MSGIILAKKVKGKPLELSVSEVIWEYYNSLLIRPHFDIIVKLWYLKSENQWL